MILKGNAVGMIRPNWNQTDPEKSDYILGREAAQKAVADALSAAQAAQTAADQANTTAQAAHTAADKAQTAADKAQAAADSKADLLALSVILLKDGWQDNTQTVDAAGITADKDRCHVIPSTPDAANNELYYASGLCCDAQLEGKVTFSCREIPDADVTVNLLILKKGVTA